MNVLLFVETTLQNAKHFNMRRLWHVRCQSSIQFHNPDNNLESFCIMRNALVHASILICTVLPYNLRATKVNTPGLLTPPLRILSKTKGVPS
jgi:hypothetical protein